MFLAISCGTADRPEGVRAELGHSSAAPNAEELLVDVPLIGTARDDRRDLRPGPEQAVRVSPPDLSTGILSTYPEISVSDPRGVLSEEERVAWIERVQLIDLTNGEPMRSHCEYVPNAHPERGETEHRFVFVPERPLGPGWYAIEFRADANMIDEVLLHRTERGTFQARFRPDSHPMITRVRTQVDDSGRVRMELLSSERVVVNEGSLRVRMNGFDADCSLFPSTQSAVQRIELSCAGLLDGVIEVTFANDIETIDGVPLSGPDDSRAPTFRFDEADLSGVSGAITLHTRELVFDRLPVAW